MSAKMKKQTIRETEASKEHKRRIAERQKMRDIATEKAREMTRSPKINPSGVGKYEMSLTDIGFPEVKPVPDARHAARLRGAADRKARGTQSSTTRKLIK